MKNWFMPALLFLLLGVQARAQDLFSFSSVELGFGTPYLLGAEVGLFADQHIDVLAGAGFLYLSDISVSGGRGDLYNIALAGGVKYWFDASKQGFFLGAKSGVVFAGDTVIGSYSPDFPLDLKAGFRWIIAEGYYLSLELGRLFSWVGKSQGWSFWLATGYRF